VGIKLGVVVFDMSDLEKTGKTLLFSWVFSCPLTRYFLGSHLYICTHKLIASIILYWFGFKLIFNPVETLMIRNSSIIPLTTRCIHGFILGINHSFLILKLGLFQNRRNSISTILSIHKPPVKLASGVFGFLSRLVSKRASERDVYDRIVLLVQSKKFDESIELMHELSLPTFIKLINYTFKVDLLNEISIKERIFEIVWGRGLYDIDLILPLLSLYGKSGETNKAYSLFLKMVDKGVARTRPFHNSLIRCHLRDPSKIDALLHQMVLDRFLPDVSTYFWMIQAYSGNVEKVEELFDSMIRDRIEPDLSVYNSVLNTHLICRRFDKAIALYLRIIKGGAKCNDMLYASIITAYSRIGDMRAVEKVYIRIQEEGIRTNAYLYQALINAYSLAGDLEGVEEIYRRMLGDELGSSLIPYTSMIVAYSKNGRLDKVEEFYSLLLRDGIKPDVYTYAPMIYAYSKNKMLDKAVEVFDSMKREGVEPDLVTYNSMIDAYSKNDQMKKAVGMFVTMKRDGIRPDVTTFATLLNCYAKSGKHVYEMMFLLRVMKEAAIAPSSHIWCTIIDGYTRSENKEDRRKALDVWKYLSGQISHECLGIDLPVKASHIVIDYVTLCVAIDACKIGRFEKEAREVWMYGQENEWIALDSNVLTSYVEFLASYGEKEADRVVELIFSGLRGEKMPLRSVKPDKKTIDHAISRLRTYGWKKQAAKLVGIVV
jgi:pentatricopeptide repeat protein